MRIIILSIALLFCAFTAQSQVLKSAGVWYFLDVDSMTARPAVLPNGTELAYVVGTKTVYYWNRNTSTWTAYGSTFNRDSIYFDSSIVGSGTVSDPWGVDSTLFATIQAVGDSIMANKQTLSFASPLLGISDGNNVDLSPLLTGYVTGPGTINRVPKWSALTNLTNSNLQDDGTAVSILNSKPFQLGQWTTAGRPSGVTGYEGYNTTGNGKEWYQGSRWAYALESTFSRGTATGIPFFDANGQITEATTTGQNARYYNAGSNLHILEVSSAIEAKGVTGVNSGNADIVVSSATSAGGRWSFSASESTGTFSFFDALSVQFPVTVVKNAGSNRFRIQSTTTDLAASSQITSTVGSTIQTTGTVTDALASSGQWRIVNGSNIVSFSPTSTSPYLAITNGTQRGYIQATSLDGFRVGSNSNHPLVFLTNGTVRGQFSTAGFLGLNTTSPLQELDVNGDVYIRDSTRLTTTPSHSSITGLLTRDANGWVGAASLAGGLSYSGGVLTGANIYTASDSIRGNRYAKMASSGGRFGLGWWPSFPSRAYNYATEYGLFIQDGSEVTLAHKKDYMAMFDGTVLVNSNYSTTKSGAEFSLNGGTARTTISTNRLTTGSNQGFNQFRQDTTGWSFRNRVGFPAVETSYSLPLPSVTAPSISSGVQTILRWEGNGSIASATFVMQKRDTTIYIDDADYDFSAALTTAQIAARYNRVVFWMTTTGGAGSDSEITLHTPDANLMQVEYIIHSVDEAGGFANVIRFGSNNAVDSTNGLVSSYFPAAGDGIHIRAGLRSGVYKYRYSI